MICQNSASAMDVILNCDLMTTPDCAECRRPDEIVWPPAYHGHDMEDDKLDFKFRTLIAYLPGAGVFYCAAGERCWSEVGVKGAHIQLDASWFRFRNEGGSTNPLGPAGYVKRWHEAASTPEAPHYSIWRVSTSGVPTRQIRRIYLATQVPDHEGPVMAPDVIEGQYVGGWSQADRGREYNGRVASLGSAKVGGRHHASCCFHRDILSDCLVIDGVDDPFVNIVVDCNQVNRCTD